MLPLLLLTVLAALPDKPLLIESVAITGADLHVKLETQVGRPYDAAAVGHDVRYLYSLGRVNDVRVELTEQPNGAAIRFAVALKPRLRLHEIRLQPHSFGFQPKLPEGSPIDDFQAQQLATQTETELKLQGYQQAHVTYSFTPAQRQEVDLRLNIESGPGLRIKRLEFSGNLGLQPKQLRPAVSGLRAKTMVPLLWHTLPDYSPEAVDAGLFRLRSLYLSQGYFDARVTAADPVVEGRDATVRFRIDAGPRFQIHGTDLTTLCPCLLGERRKAERQGILDFAPAIHVERESTQPVAGVTTKAESGAPFRVRRVEFFGLHRYSDTTVRRNLLLDEGAPLDQYLLRKSIARIAQTRLFEAVSSRDIVIVRNEVDHVADIKLRLTERKNGSWNLSGPVGPASIAGPIRASLMSRLPPWGHGVLELATYTASVSLLAFAQPIIPALAVKRFVPVFALARGFLPGDSWRTGFVIAPQLGWQGSLISTASAQMQGRLLPLLTPNRGLVPDLTVSVEGDGVQGAILCQAQKPRLSSLRTAASIAVRLPGAITGF
jgi:surface antigen-like variable number repeat protein